AGQLLDVLRVDGWEHTDAQLVAAQFAVRLGVQDAGGAQNLGDLGGVDGVVEVDGAHDQGAAGRWGDERGGTVAARGPAVPGAGGVGGALGPAGPGALVVPPLPLVVEQHQGGGPRGV